MIESQPAPDVPVLAYAEPSLRDGRPILGAVLALLAAIAGGCGVVLPFYGIAAIPYVMVHANSVDLGSDAFELTMFLLIGFFFLYISIRWFRAVPRVIAGG